jgi:DNA repair protein RecO (recombination protein O)
MQWTEPGIVIGTRRHGEADVILEVITEGRGRHLGLVKGGRGRRLRPVVQPGNTLALTWRARLHEHLGNFRVEPLVERSRLVVSGLGAFGLSLAAAHLRLLPERDPHPRLYDAVAPLLDGLDSPHSGATAMARFELLLLDELGFGLDLATCAATGQSDDLAYVSPKSGRAVSGEAGLPYASRLLALPTFLIDGAGEIVAPAELDAAFRLTGYFLERHIHAARGQDVPECRALYLQALRSAPWPAEPITARIP